MFIFHMHFRVEKGKFLISQTCGHQAGQIIEFDSPENLKTRENGVYRSMYDAAMGNKKDQ